jgi:methylthioribulose-1-phosphate dehydratase
MRLAITASGVSKGELRPSHVCEIDAHGAVAGRCAGRPSAETALHLTIADSVGARAVIHTHSIWNTLLSERCARDHGVAIEGYEMLKGLRGISTHEHREWIPILDNDQDLVRLSTHLRAVLCRQPACHAVLLRRHGMYTWGDSLREATRHVEIIEFLLEIIGRIDGHRYCRRCEASLS